MPLPDIERWVPATWDDVVGNAVLKEHFQDQLAALRTGQIEKGVNTFITGPTRSGKTSTVLLFARCLLCEHLDLIEFNPCGTCEPCRDNYARYGEQGTFTFLAGRNIHFTPIDCMQIQGAEHLRELISRMADVTAILKT